MWDGGRCFIIGGGPSMPKQFDIPDEIIAQVRSGQLGPEVYSPFMASIHNEHVIGVNNAYQIGTWIDVCLFGDCGWYLVHRQKLARWPNLKVGCCYGCPDYFGPDGIKYVARDRIKKVGIGTNPSKLSWGYNSGTAAINFAAHTGAKQIILLGFDMSYPEPAITHWHKGHGNQRKSFKRFLRGFSSIAVDATKLDIEILNAGQESAITQFRKVSLEEVL
jgi:hypothetical protein